MPAVSTKRSRLTVVLHHLIDGVAGGAGNRAKRWRGWRPGEDVEQGTFSNVRAADDCDGGLVLLELPVRAVEVFGVFRQLPASVFHRLWVGETSASSKYMVEQIANAHSVFCGDRQYLADAQAAVLGNLVFHALGVDLVDHQHQGLAAA